MNEQVYPMRVHIFDVEHGECNAIETPSGHLVLIGVGNNSTTGWRPSTWLRQRNQRPAWVILTNLDRDHCSDLRNLEPDFRPNAIKTNSHLSSSWVKAKKLQESGEIHESVAMALHWVDNVFTGGEVYPDVGFEMQFFHHSPQVFQDTNNLSVVTFIRYAGFGIMFPGDLETAGWMEFLNSHAFRACLSNTNILIASHHGRRTGYCAEIFEYCRPDAVLISDKPVAHDTQRHNLYEGHCFGLNFGSTLRKVLTTRNDGKLTIEVQPTGSYTLRTHQIY